MKKTKKQIQEAKQALNLRYRAGLISEEYYNVHLNRYILIEDAAADLEKAMSKDLAGAVGDLKSLASNPEFKDLANKGKEDGQAEDEKVGFSTKDVPNTKMFPTQAEIGFGNSLDDIVFDKFEVIEKSFASSVKLGPKGGTPVLCAEIGGQIAILDGHHRWSACFMANPGAMMTCDIMQAPAGMDAGDALKAMQLGIAAKAGNVKTKPFEGKDLMAVSTEEVMAYVKKNIVPTAIAKFKKYKPELFKGKTMSEADGLKQGKDSLDRDIVAKHIGRSHKLILKMKGPYPRTIMPQAGDSGTSQSAVNNAFQSGEINFKEPFTVKESVKRVDNMLKESVKKSTL